MNEVSNFSMFLLTIFYPYIMVEFSRCYEVQAGTMNLNIF